MGLFTSAQQSVNTGTATITNLIPVAGSSTGSRPGEDNHLHAALAVGGIGILAILTGYLNVRLGKGSRGSG